MTDPDVADDGQLTAGAAIDIYNLQIYADKAHAILLQCANQPEAP